MLNWIVWNNTVKNGFGVWNNTVKNGFGVK